MKKHIQLTLLTVTLAGCFNGDSLVDIEEIEGKSRRNIGGKPDFFVEEKYKKIFDVQSQGICSLSMDRDKVKYEGNDIKYLIRIKRLNNKVLDCEVIKI